jgi:3-phosphoshikimate 1-carboxyvinyltransferase
VRLVVKGTDEPLSGELDVPASKYHAHRALMLASLAEGTSRIHGSCGAGHVRHTVGALRGLGTAITVERGGFTVHGGPYRPARDEISVGSSGTTLYFLAGLASLAGRPVTVTGQKYFRHRPIRPLLDALAGLGVEVASETGTVPLRLSGRRPSGGSVRIAGVLSQWISGLLLIAPFATGPTRIEVVGPFNERSYVDLTLAMMARFGLHVECGADGRVFHVDPGQRPVPAEIRLPPDVGAAAFGLAAAALHPSDVVLRNLPAVSAGELDHPEADLLTILERAGLPLLRDEPTGWVRVRHDGSRLEPVTVDCRSVPDMLPVLSTLACHARGTTVLENVAHVRLKESDRVAAMLQLNRMGGKLAVDGERLLVEGVGRLHAAGLSSFNDHRVLMSLAVAASAAEGESTLTYPHAYRISYPAFLEQMNGVGLNMAVVGPVAGSAAPRRAGAPSPGRLAAVPLGELVRRHARERPDDEAVVEAPSPGRAGGALSWGELDQQADTLAQLLLELGVAAGESVAWQLPNRLEFAVLALAAVRIGAVCCPLMPFFREREVAFALRRARARVFVVCDEFRGRRPAEETAALLGAADPPALEHVLVVGGHGPLPASAGPARWQRVDQALAAMRPDSAALAARRPAPEAYAQLMFTSGTSGEPKGVLHRGATLTRAVAMLAREVGLTAEDRLFVPSPLAHQTGFLYGMWLGFVLGATQVLEPVWDAGRALETLNRTGGTFIQAATPFLADLVDAVEAGGRAPEALRIFVATGAAVPRALAERATRVLDAAVCGAWGSTESCLGSVGSPGDEPGRAWGTDGRALRGVRLRITDPDGRRVRAAGVEGAFEVSGPTLFDGYLDHPEWTAEALTPDGWYRTGDLAVIDEDGYVRITGRVKDVINRGGEKIPVAEIEQLLHTHPAVREAAVVAMPDARLGERACLFAAVRRPFTFEQMQQFLNERKVAKQYWPERLETVAELPRNPSGKVQKFLLRDRIRAVVDQERATAEPSRREHEEVAA